MMTTTYRRAAARQFNRRAGGTASFRRILCGATSRFTRPLVSGAGFLPSRASSVILRRRTPNTKVIVPGTVYFVRSVVSTEALLRRARRGNSSVQHCGLNLERVAECKDATLKWVIIRCPGGSPVGCNKPGECEPVQVQILPRSLVHAGNQNRKEP